MQPQYQGAMAQQHGRRAAHRRFVGLQPRAERDASRRRSSRRQGILQRNVTALQDASEHSRMRLRVRCMRSGWQPGADNAVPPVICSIESM